MLDVEKSSLRVVVLAVGENSGRELERVGVVRKEFLRIFESQE